MDTTETVPSGVGFASFGTLHFVWIGIFIFLTVGCIIWYRKLANRGRRIWRISIAALLVADEIFKVVMLIAGGRFLPSYLPLHLCSINIFIIAYHASNPQKSSAVICILRPFRVRSQLCCFPHGQAFRLVILCTCTALRSTFCWRSIQSH